MAYVHCVIFCVFQLVHRLPQYVSSPRLHYLLFFSGRASQRRYSSFLVFVVYGTSCCLLHRAVCYVVLFAPSCCCRCYRQGPSALDPRSGSIFFGGRSISSIYRRSRIDIAGPQIDEISSIYRRYIVDISTIYIVDILNVTFLFIS